MTAQASSETTNKTKRKSFFGKRFVNAIGSNKKCFIVNCVMELLGLPVAAVLALIMCYYEENYDKLSRSAIDAIENGVAAFAIIAVVAVGISIITAIPTVLTHFSYLHKKANADMHYALPLSNKQRFFADYLSGLTVYLGPVIAAVILAFAILGVGSIFIDTGMLWKEVIPLIFKIGIAVFLGMLQLYTISVFALMFCGRGFEAGFSICAFNVLIPSTIACLWLAAIEKSTFGIVADSLLQMNIFTDTSPFGAAAFIIANFDDCFISSGFGAVFNRMFAKWIILNILCTAVYALAAFLLYRSRKAEDVSKPYVHHSFFYALMTMAVFCVLSLFVIGDAPVSAGVVICAIGWFIMEVVTRRGFKKFWTAAVSFVIATAAVFGVLGICTFSDGFGVSKRVPSVNSVKSVIIDHGSSQLISNAEFTDEKVIEEVIKLNRECVDRYYDTNKGDYPSVDKNDNIYTAADDYIRITYVTKTGKLILREYTVAQSMESDLIKAIFLSDDAAALFTKDIGNDNYYDNETFAISANRMYDSKVAAVSQSEIIKFKEDMAADIMDMTEDDLVNGDVYCYMDNTMFVLKSFKRTMANLEELGISLNEPVVENDYTIMVDPVIASYYKVTYESEDEYSPSNDLNQLSEIDGMCTFSQYGYCGSMAYGKVYGIDQNNPYTKELVKSATSFIIGEKPIAVIDMPEYGYSYFLKNTPENRELIENLMKYKTEEYTYNPYNDYYEDTDIDYYY